MTEEELRLSDEIFKFIMKRADDGELGYGLHGVYNSAAKAFEDLASLMEDENSKQFYSRQANNIREAKSKIYDTK